jgi:hypothetical protein
MMVMMLRGHESQIGTPNVKRKPRLVALTCL